MRARKLKKVHNGQQISQIPSYHSDPDPDTVFIQKPPGPHLGWDICTIILLQRLSSFPRGRHAISCRRPFVRPFVKRGTRKGGKGDTLDLSSPGTELICTVKGIGFFFVIRNGAQTASKEKKSIRMKQQKRD